MKTLVNNESSLEGIQPVNTDPYIANIYRKQVEFYYKYVELLYTLEIKLFQIEGSSGRGPRMYTILNNASPVYENGDM